MTVFQLVASASLGARRNDEEHGYSEDAILAIYEIRNKADELRKMLADERWDKDQIAAKTSVIVWECARLAGMYGADLDTILSARSGAPRPVAMRRPARKGKRSK